MSFLSQLVNPIIRIFNYILFIAFTSFSIAQTDNSSLTKHDKESTLNDYITSNEDTIQFGMKKSPWGAVLRSSILPGFGQFYNESYWKIPIVLGGIGYFFYEWNSNNNLYNKYRDLYLHEINKNSTASDFYYKQKEKVRDQRDMYAIFIGLAYLLNLIDAYVDAHLFDFNVTNEPLMHSIRLNMQINY
jgi:hypothetical protein